MQAVVPHHFPWTRRHLRALADGRIAHGGETVDTSVAWRVQELTSARERRRLARAVRGVVKDISPSRLPGATPTNRTVLRPHVPLIEALAERLGDLDRPVTGAGALAVRSLLTNPDGPLYARPGRNVAAALQAVLDLLGPR